MQCINLLIQYVNDRRPGRQAEYDECLRRNLANPYVKSVHDLQESARVQMPEEFANHPKLRRHALNHWMTYQDAFEYAKTALSGEICCITNLDIFLDPDGTDWTRTIEILQQKVVFCLSRIEFNPDGSAFHDPDLMKWAFSNSQDAWLFRSPVDIPNSDFKIGTRGCDNAIAHRIKEAGYLPVNAPQQFKIFHYDRVRGKTLDNQQQVRDTERDQAVRNAYPEREGHYLLPDIDSLKSIDQLLEQLKVTDLQRYSALCDVLNKFVRLYNP